MSDRLVETVVTYLVADRAPRPLPPKPAGSRLALMKVDAIPLHYYRYLYRAVGVDWLWFERLVLDDAALAAAVHRDGVEIFVLYGNGAPAGYYELDFSRRARTNLVYFGLLPDWTGQRIGPWLLASAMLEGFSRGAGEITVNTCTLDHQAALPLYRRLGFRAVSREARRLSIPAGIPIPGHIAARPAP